MKIKITAFFLLTFFNILADQYREIADQYRKIGESGDIALILKTQNEISKNWISGDYNIKMQALGSGFQKVVLEKKVSFEDMIDFYGTILEKRGTIQFRQQLDVGSLYDIQFQTISFLSRVVADKIFSKEESKEILVLSLAKFVEMYGEYLPYFEFKPLSLSPEIPQEVFTDLGVQKAGLLSDGFDPKVILNPKIRAAYERKIFEHKKATYDSTMQSSLHNNIKYVEKDLMVALKQYIKENESERDFFIKMFNEAGLSDLIKN